jgi:sec-independent protein translocase protein TatA
MPDIGVPELLIILVIVLLLFGPGRLGEAGADLGRAIREFRQAVQGKEEPPALEEPDRGEDSQWTGW